MKPVTRTARWRGGFVAALPCGLMLVAAAAGPAVAAGCAFEPQGEGRVTAVIDSRTFRLEDGREVPSPASSRPWPKKPAAHRRWRQLWRAAR